MFFALRRVRDFAVEPFVVFYEKSASLGVHLSYFTRNLHPGRPFVVFYEKSTSWAFTCRILQEIYILGRPSVVFYNKSSSLCLSMAYFKCKSTINYDKSWPLCLSRADFFRKINDQIQQIVFAFSFQAFILMEHQR